MSAEGAAQDIGAGPSDLNSSSHSTPPSWAGLFSAGASRLLTLHLGGECPFLYEMLAGRRAFQRDSAAETMNVILKEDPPPASSADPRP